MQSSEQGGRRERNGRLHTARSLILVKHAAPDIEPQIDAAEWRLSESGRAACLPLAKRLVHYRPDAVVASLEPKAAETGQIVATRLGVPFATAPDLHEHDRTGVPFLTNAEEWYDAIRRFFDHPDEVVLGRESAIEVGERFARAVASVIARHKRGNLAIVAHGTVISLFVARHNAIEPFALCNGSGCRRSSSFRCRRSSWSRTWPR